jgi:threonine dehydratase
MKGMGRAAGFAVPPARYWVEMPATYDVTLADIRGARERIAPYVRRTPLVSSETLSARLGTDVSLKLELFQKTGSFKVRGAFNKALAKQLQPGDRVVAVSGGNHAQAVAYAGRKLGLHATIFMPDKTPLNYLEATRGYGAEVVLVSNIAEAFEKMAEYEERGATGIHPFDDPYVLAGQGTVGLEILEDLPGVTDLVVSIGGGGFIGGVAVAVKALKPDVRIWGVETVGADAMALALAAGHVVQMPAITSIAKTLGAPSVSEKTLELARQHLESVTVVPDSEALSALQFLLERAKVLAEPAASCTLAAAERLRDRFTPESKVVLVLCGGNVALRDVCAWTAGRTE